MSQRGYAVAYDDLLVCFSSYPEATPPGVVSEAARVTAALGASACAVAGHIEIPLKSNQLAEMLLHLSDLARDEEAKSLQNAQSVMQGFKSAAQSHGLSATTTIIHAELHTLVDRLTQMARTRSLTILPIEAFASVPGGLAEALIFGSGRPVVVFAHGQRMPPRPRFERIVVAWDGGRAAARAVADAMPLLRRAEEVSILAVIGDKPSVPKGALGELVRHLAACGVAAVPQEVTKTDPDIGRVINDYAVATGADLLVMGAFGHSRVREFVLGGATQSLLTEASIPVFMSH